jgi:hypothetical protein
MKHLTATVFGEVDLETKQEDFKNSPPMKNEYNLAGGGNLHCF